MDTRELKREIAQDIIDRIDDYIGTDKEELHHNLYNTDYYIVGTYDAKQWLNKYDVFDCIELIREYEQDNFGIVNTDLSDPEKIVNMVVYIIGEEILQDFELYNGASIITKRFASNMKNTLRKLYNLSDNTNVNN